jgi:hypothetical protein
MLNNVIAMPGFMIASFTHWSLYVSSDVCNCILMKNIQSIRSLERYNEVRTHRERYIFVCFLLESTQLSQY